jgi:hypothetical protein
MGESCVAEPAPRGRLEWQEWQEWEKGVEKGEKVGRDGLEMEKSGVKWCHDLKSGDLSVKVGR